jgi:hypothetical protein
MTRRRGGGSRLMSIGLIGLVLLLMAAAPAPDSAYWAES